MSDPSRPLHLTGTVVVDDTTVLSEIWVADGRIHLSPPPGADSFEQVRGVVVPGLVDVHAHIGLGAEGAVDEATAEAQAVADRDSGVLLVRDAGSPADTRWVDDRDDLPRLIRAGRHIARPKRYIRSFARELDDVALLPEVVAEEARRGDGWVKLVGDWIDRSMGADADLTPLWPREVLRDAVAAAHENGARVTIHTFATETVEDCLAAGVDCLEHGTGMTTDHMAELAARGVPVTVTARQTSQFGDFADQAVAKYPIYAARMRAMHERRRDFWGEVVAAGVPLLMGSDAGGTLDHGTLPAELVACAELELPHADVLAAASWRGRDYLGVDGITDGASADLVVYPSDPRADVSVTQRPTAIVLRGTTYRPHSGE
ncbi:amidohydrolase family protein [Georgenia sp. Z1491]|uniref:amidohydrolase family protein n=1 Tax=Georgenia sp. Z1491 TaxID=3416707 RepID=UPI003CF8AEBD